MEVAEGGCPSSCSFPSSGPGLQSTQTKPTEGHNAELPSQVLLTLSQNC